MIEDAMILLSAICFAGLIGALFWPMRKRKDVTRPPSRASRWPKTPNDPDIRLRDWQMDEWRAGRRSAPPSDKVRSAARRAEDRLVRMGMVDR